MLQIPPFCQDASSIIQTLQLTLSQAGFFELFKDRVGLFCPQQKNYYKTCSFHRKPMKLDTFDLLNISNENNFVTCFKNNDVIKVFVTKAKSRNFKFSVSS